MIKVFSHTEPGGHARNEDAFAVQLHGHDSESFLCVVADGQGGRAGGEAAAQLACRALLTAAGGYSATDLLRPSRWSGILHTVDQAVFTDPSAGLTTVVAFYLTGDHVCGASCGDSAAVLLQATKPAEVLTARQVKNPPLGSGDASFVAFAAEMSSPWTVMAMSDGVWKYAGWDNVVKIATEMRGEEIIPSIRDCAKLQKSGELQDDFTIVVFQNVGN